MSSHRGVEIRLKYYQLTKATLKLLDHKKSLYTLYSTPIDNGFVITVPIMVCNIIKSVLLLQFCRISSGPQGLDIPLGVKCL